MRLFIQIMFTHAARPISSLARNNTLTASRLRAMNKTLVEAAVDGDMQALIDALSQASKKYPLNDMLAQVGGVYGWTALSAAAHKNHEEVVSVLLDAGANPNQQDEDGDNFPLHWARQPAVARLLVNAGADLAVLNRGGLTPLEIAEREENEGVIAILKVRAGPQCLYYPASTCVVTSALPDRRHAGGLGCAEAAMGAPGVSKASWRRETLAQGFGRLAVTTSCALGVARAGELVRVPGHL